MLAGIDDSSRLWNKKVAINPDGDETTGVLPVHKATGKPAPNAMTQHKIEPLMRHLQYLTNLGEVRATRVVSTVVEGMDADGCRLLHPY